jgi:activator of HSP90 ATPase
MKTNTIIQEVSFKASPAEVYEYLMDSRKHSRITRSRASISKLVGGKFSVYDGGIHGENVQLRPARKIVQKWKTEEKCWPKGHYSRASFSFHKKGSGTHLRFRHSGIPSRCATGIKKGWTQHYWAPMKEILN